MYTHMFPLCNQRDKMIQPTDSLRIKPTGITTYILGLQEIIRFSFIALHILHILHVTTCTVIGFHFAIKEE